MMEEGSKNPRWDREKTAEVITDYEKKKEEIVSQRQYAEQQGVPRTTLQHWLKRKNSIDHEQAVVEFFESPDGLAVLHRILMAAKFTIELVGNDGIRSDCLFLELSGLDKFVASSYGAQQKVSQSMEREIVLRHEAVYIFVMKENNHNPMLYHWYSNKTCGRSNLSV